jgi:hypothetical protein
MLQIHYSLIIGLRYGSIGTFCCNRPTIVTVEKTKS